MFAKFIEKKAKEIVSEFLDNADLDKNGIKDKEQVLQLIDRVSKVLQAVVKTVDLPKVLAAVEQISQAVSVLAGAVDKVALLQHAAELQAIGKEVAVFVKALLPKEGK